MNAGRAQQLARILGSLDYKPDDFANITPFREDAFRETHFIFFMTAIDHNTHAGLARYEAIIDGRLLHGSDLLYARAIAAAAADPDRFTPARMPHVSASDLAVVFTTPEGRAPVGLEERATLLKNAAVVLTEHYGADVRNLFESAGGYIRRPDGKGLQDRLAKFLAYEDPIGKKTFLLIKLLRRRGRLAVSDPENILVPVDHVVFTLALRSGLVVAAPWVLREILSGQCLSEDIVHALRQETLLAYRMVAEYARLHADEFDDLLWAYGRECLRMTAPFPEETIASIDIPLNQRVGNAEALANFIRFITGIDGGAPRGAALLPVPVVPATWYI